MGFKEFMAERKEIDRWLIAVVFITGMFCGAAIATVYFIGLAVL